MSAETTAYLQEAGPFAVSDASPLTWEILAANNDILAVCDDEDVANYIREALNFAAQTKTR